MIHVTVVDDHPLVREGIKKVLDKESDIKVIGEAADGNGAIDLIDDRLPDILIVDLTMPGKSGLELIKDIKKRHPNLPVLVLSIHPSERFAVRSLKAGASGYLSKSSISEELIDAIHTVISDKRKYITAEVAELLAQQVDHNGDNTLHTTLSDREFEVLCMIASGKDVGQIALELSLSVNTIHTYRSRIKDKMSLESNVEMTRYAIQNDLIS